MNKVLNAAQLDLMLIKEYSKTTIYTLVVAVLISLSMRSIVLGMLSTAMILAMRLVSLPFDSQEKTAIDRFYSTIPVLEEQRVIGRYVFLFIFGTAGMLLSFVIQGLIYAIMQLRFTAADYILAILGGLFLYLFFVAIETPFYYRFGVIKGRFSLFIPLFIFMVFSFGLNWLESRQIVIPAVFARLLEDRIQLLLLAGIVVLVLLALSLMVSMRWRPEESN